MNGHFFETVIVWLQYAEQHIEELIAMGGPVMWPLLVVSLLLWTLILERYFYLLHVFPVYIKDSLPILRSSADRIIETAQIIFLLRRHLRLIKTLSGILPMLGLLGTVTGIVETFDLIRLFGSAEPRIVARGVSQALITTMTGLVLGLFGVAVGYDLKRRANTGERRFRSQTRSHE
jgi:biopolymer transport protein ExbB